MERPGILLLFYASLYTRRGDVYEGFINLNCGETPRHRYGEIYAAGEWKMRTAHPEKWSIITHRTSSPASNDGTIIILRESKHKPKEEEEQSLGEGKVVRNYSESTVGHEYCQGYALVVYSLLQRLRGAI